MNRDQKAAVIEEIAADITGSQAVFAIDYRGITVAQAEALRARLRDCDASFRVVKNSLGERAADQAGTPELRPLLEGPTALTFVRGDAAAAAKAIADFARTTQLLAFKGGLMDGATLSAGDVASISRLPSREVLYGQLVGLVANPIAGLARSLGALVGGLAVALGGVLEQRGGAPAESSAPAEVEAEAEPEASSEVEAEGTPEGEAEAEPEASGEVEAEAPAADASAGPPEAEAEAAAEAGGEVEAAAEPEAGGEVEASELEGVGGEPASETDESKEN